MHKASRYAILAVDSIASTPTLAWAQQQPPGSYRYACGPSMMDWGGGWYGMIFGPLFVTLVLGLAIAVVVLLVRWPNGRWHSSQPPDHARPAHAPLDILRERYARGEIDKEEFEERSRVLGDQPG